MIARTKSIFHLQNNLIHAIEIMCNNCCAKYTDVDIIFHICIFHCMKNNVYNYFILFFYCIYILIIFIVQTIVTWALNKKNIFKQCYYSGKRPNSSVYIPRSDRFIDTIWLAGYVVGLYYCRYSLPSCTHTIYMLSLQLFVREQSEMHLFGS